MFSFSYLFTCFSFGFLFFFCFMSELKIGSLNLNGARDERKRATFFRLCSLKKLDVIFVQETHSTVDNEVDWKREWEGDVFLSHKTSNSCGVGVLFSKSFSPQSVECEEFIEGRLLKVRVLYENVQFVFITVYAPAVGKERLTFLENVNDAIRDCNDKEFLFIGGDWNCTESRLDRNHVEPHPASRTLLIQLLETHELHDVWRGLHDSQRQYTWTHCKDNLLSMARLDRFYCFKHHSNVVKNCFISPVGFSDHSLVVICVFLKCVKPSSAYWHFNTALLEDSNFKEIFVSFWKNHQSTKNDFMSLQQWWDFGKVQTKQLCQQYNCNVTRVLLKSVKALESEVEELQALAEATKDQCYLEALEIKKSVLTTLLGVSAQGALIRSRFKSVVEMDVPSHFFFGLEQKNGQKRYIHSLKSDSGHVLSDHAAIRKLAVSFYCDLYKCEHREEQMLAQSFYSGLPQVKQESNVLLEADISLGELYVALQSMQSRKTPGLDGLPVDFYKCFWFIIGEDLLAVLKDSLANGRLPLSCRRAVLTLLPKKGDLQLLKNWRPVSLLCTDYKLLSKALANRLVKVMEQIVLPDQTYCVPGRLISDNIVLIRDLLEIAKLFGLKMGIISIDQEKAFDRVEHEYLWQTMMAFGFTSGFINKIKTLYFDVQSVLKVNGVLSTPFQVQRGIRQGCALSGMLYSLAFEPFLHKLRSVLQGVILPGCNMPLKLSAYADDLVVMVDNQQDIDMLTNVIDQYGIISSARVNWSKSEALCIGVMENNFQLPVGLNWKTDGGLKYLGVFLGDETFVLKNWDNVLERTKGCFARWKWILPKMSYRGRVLVINNLISSTLWHRLSCVDPPPDLLSKIQALLVDFFWDRLHWTRQSVLFLPKDEGGQGLIHLNSRGATFRFQFVQRFLCGPVDLVWRPLACTILNQLGGLGLNRTLFLMDLKQLNTSGLPSFYRGLFKVWNLFKTERTEHHRSLYWLLQEPVVYGTRLSAACQIGPSLLKRFCSSNVLTLGHVIHFTGANMDNAQLLASHLKVHSIRMIELLLKKWKEALTDAERTLLQFYCGGPVQHSVDDFFPLMKVLPDFKDCTGFFLGINNPCLSIHDADKKLLYRLIVKILNKDKLNGKIDTPWRARLGLIDGVGPEWRSLYKPPLLKKVADLQWRVLHTAVAVNSFISVLNPDVNHDCPFCTLRETVFHCFIDCCRLVPLFSMLEDLFKLFGVVFSKQLFILGYRYSQKKREQCQLFNFILGRAKMAVYMSRRNKVEGLTDDDAVFVFVKMLKSRLRIDFNYYRLMNDLGKFSIIWCHKDVLCSIVENNLIFKSVLI